MVVQHQAVMDNQHEASDSHSWLQKYKITHELTFATTAKHNNH